jgi:hypothetical protein
MAKDGRGGARKGAGRPPLPDDERKVHFNAYLDAEVVAWLHECAQAAGTTASAIANGILRRSKRAKR